MSRKALQSDRTRRPDCAILHSCCRVLSYNRCQRPVPMLHEFIAINRAEIIRRCRAKVATRSAPPLLELGIGEPAVVTPAPDERPLTEAGNTFGSRLRDTRERAHITLESIASATKIKQSLLAALERNDVSQWPRGICRRAFLRDYATAIGLRSEEVLVEFLRLFPEDEQLLAPLVEQPADEFRLTLAGERRSGIRFAFMRGLATIRDSLLVFLAGKIAAWLSGQPLWTVTATYAVSLEFETKAPLTLRGTVRATKADTCLVRAFRQAVKEFPGERWSSLVVVLKRVEDPSDSAVAERGNTAPWTEGTPVNELPLPSRARSPHRGTHRPPQLPSVPPQPTAGPSGADQSVGP
jgi:transcriptional regulator with XRE-family HTH domain